MSLKLGELAFFLFFSAFFSFFLLVFHHLFLFLSSNDAVSLKAHRNEDPFFHVTCWSTYSFHSAVFPQNQNQKLFVKATAKRMREEMDSSNYTCMLMFGKMRGSEHCVIRRNSRKVLPHHAVEDKASLE